MEEINVTNKMIMIEFLPSYKLETDKLSLDGAEGTLLLGKEYIIVSMTNGSQKMVYNRDKVFKIHIKEAKKDLK